MIIDNNGARRLIASILKKACDDYTSDNLCPAWCAFKDTCELKKVDDEQCDAKRFIHSAWCATLCDSLDIDHEEYVAVCIKKHRLSKNTLKYVEQEIRQYKNNQKELNRLKNAIIMETPEKQEGRSNAIGNSTASKAIKISMDRKIVELDRTQKAIETIYQRLCHDKQALMEEYWNRRYTNSGLADKLGVDERTIRRWKQYIVYSVAAELNYL
ncbi:MAG: hypothetical protein EOL98_01420 [Negativicutes bacterium]|nr:hypothetical protein [Negativicutes bacterium]